MPSARENIEPVLPARLIGRLGAEFVIDCLVATRHACFAAFTGGATYDRVVLYLALMRHAACPLPGARVAPGAVSIAGLAASLNQPFETLRRHVQGLERHGLVERTSAGVILTTSHCYSPEMLALAHHIHDAMVSMIADLLRLGISMPPTRQVDRCRPAETLNSALDMALYLCERMRPVHGTSLAAVVTNVIVTANVRSITHDPVLAMQYGAIDTIPPDHLRRPIKVASIARAISLPYSTVAREVKRLSATGVATIHPDGVIVNRGALAKIALTDNNRAATFRTVQIVQRLRNGGFNFTDPDRHYFAGAKPVPIAFD